MDLVLNFLDTIFLSRHIYPVSWPEESWSRQAVTVYVFVAFGGWLLYLITAFLNYAFLYDHMLMKHPLFLPNQLRREILYASKSIPLMTLGMVPFFMLEIHGFSKLYIHKDTQPGLQELGYLMLSILLYLMFTDCCIYWIHRFLHHRRVYKYIHKPHHLWKVPTPFASHAFHPIDGYLQALPYHIFPFIFPLHKVLYLLLFLFVNLWTVSIHDGHYSVPNLLKPIINGSAHHTDHHLFYNCNYGQYFTLWDRIGGSFRRPLYTSLKDCEELQRSKDN